MGLESIWDKLWVIITGKAAAYIVGLCIIGLGTGIAFRVFQGKLLVSIASVVLGLSIVVAVAQICSAVFGVSV